MIDPFTILTVVQLIGSAASTASENKSKCLELAERANNLNYVLPNFAHAAANDPATARVLERLRDAVGEALRLIQSCQGGGMFSGKYSSSKADELDSVDKRINNCIMDLNLISQARTTNVAAAAGSVPAQSAGEHVHYSSYYQAQGAASSAHVVWPPPPQHAAWSTPQAYYQQPPPPPTPTPQHAWSTPHGYYEQPPGYAQWAPAGPASPYHAPSPAPSGSDLSSLYTLPTVNKIFKSVFR